MKTKILEFDYEAVVKNAEMFDCTYYLKCNLCQNLSRAFSKIHNADNLEHWKCLGCGSDGTQEILYIKINSYNCLNCNVLIDGHRNFFHMGLCEKCEVSISKEDYSKIVEKLDNFEVNGGW